MGRRVGGGGSRDELEFIVLRRFEAWRIVSATCQWRISFCCTNTSPRVYLHYTQFTGTAVKSALVFGDKTLQQGDQANVYGCIPSLLCSNARAPVAQLVKASVQSPKDSC